MHFVGTQTLRILFPDEKSVETCELFLAVFFVPMLQSLEIAIVIHQAPLSNLTPVDNIRIFFVLHLVKLVVAARNQRLICFAYNILVFFLIFRCSCNISHLAQFMTFLIFWVCFFILVVIYRFARGFHEVHQGALAAHIDFWMGNTRLAFGSHIFLIIVHF